MAGRHGALRVVLAACGAAAIVTAQTLSFNYVFPPLTFSPTSRAFALMSRNATHAAVVGGEPDDASSATLNTLFVQLDDAGAPLGIVGEAPPRGAAVRASRAAWAYVDAPIGTGSSVPGRVTRPYTNPYTVAFGGQDVTGAARRGLSYYYPSTNTWVTQPETGGGPAPTARVGAAMAYLYNCVNFTSCVVMSGGASGSLTGTSGAPLPDTNTYAWFGTRTAGDIIGYSSVDDTGTPTIPTTVCAQGGMIPENAMMTLICPPNTYISAITFASYGTPTGTCGAYVINPACHATTTFAIVQAACLGENVCNMFNENGLFTDPCVGTFKRMAVQAVCTPNQGWMTLPPQGSPPSPRAFASLVPSPDGSLAYMFGGRTSTGVTNDLYVLSTGAGFTDALSGTAELWDITRIGGVAAAQSSTFSTATAGLAISPSASSSFRNTGGQIVCSSTVETGSTNPYWRVDLGSMQPIASITLTQRTDCCGGRMAGFQVYVGPYDTSPQDAANVRCNNPYADFPTASVTLSCPTEGRFVWVTLPGANRVLTLCGVNVWQRVPWVWRQMSQTLQVATGKTAWQSSTYTVGGQASRAVDGVATNVWGTLPPTCSHTLPNPPATLPAMFTLDLGAVYDVSRLVVWPRTDCCTNRNTRWQIYIGNSQDYRYNTRCTNVPADVTPTGTGGGPQSTSITCAAQGRYVIILRPWLASDDNILTICELNVFANAIVNLPAARAGHAAALYRGQMLLSGGVDGSGNRLNDVQLLDLTTRRWTQIGTIVGTPPAPRAYSMMLPTRNNSVLLFGGVGSAGASLSDLLALTFPPCSTYWAPNTYTSCYYGGTSCLVACSGGYSVVSPTLTCGPFGEYTSRTPACVGPPAAVPGGALTAPIVTINDFQSINVVVPALTPAQLAPYSTVSYLAASLVDTYLMRDFVTGVAPSDWLAWTWRDPLATQFFSFQREQLVVSSDPNGNCFNAQQSCAIAYRNAFPPTVSPAGNFYMEAYVYLDTSLNPVASGVFAGIGVFDMGLNIAQVYLGVMSNGGTYSVLWEHSYNSWSQAVALPNQLNCGAFVRITRSASAGTWTASWRQNYGDSWTTLPFIAPDSALQNGVPIPPTNMRPMFVSKNWSGNRAFHYYKYLAIGAAACNTPGCIRSSGTAGTTTVSGLSSGVQYSLRVATSSDYGMSAWSAPAIISTPAAPARPVPPTFNVALNRPTSQIGVWYWPNGNNDGRSIGGFPQYGNDGDLQQNHGAYLPSRLACIDTWSPGSLTNPWWQVDLGRSTDVRVMTLYGRSDCCLQRSNNLQFYVGDSPSWSSNTQCPGVTTNLASAPYTQTFNCSLTGRFVTVVSPLLSDALNFCELQVWAANSCPPRSAAFSTIFPGSTCVGAAWGQVCQLQCQPGFIAVAGSTVSTCRGASWDQPNLVCAPVCPDPTPPTPLGTCTQSLLAEGFANATSASQRFASLISTHAIGTQWHFVDGTVQAAGLFGCTTDLLLVALSNAVQNYVSAFTLSAMMSTYDAAGLLFKATDRFNFYRAVIDVASGVHYIERVLAGVTTRLIDAPMPLLAGAWYKVTITYSNAVISMVVNNTVLMTTSDGTLVTGNAGLFASTAAFFKALSFDAPCGATCTATAAQGVCRFTCPAGYTSSNSGVMTCALSTDGSTASWQGTPPSCTLPPPLFFGASIVTPEAAPINAAVGAPLVASSRDPTSQVLFAITAGNINGAFWVDACSGQLKVRNATAVDIVLNPVFSLTVQAYIAGQQATSFTNAAVTVTLTPVQRPPVVPPAMFYVREKAAPGTVIGQLRFTSRLPMTVNWTLPPALDTSRGLFNVSTSGVLTVSVAAAMTPLNFFASPNTFALSVTATNALNATLFSSGVITVVLNETNNAPTLAPAAQVLFVNQLDAVNGAPAGMVTSTKLNNQNPASPFASAITYSLVSGAAAAIWCPVNATNSANTWYATPSGNATDVPMFNIAPNGTLIFRAVDRVAADQNPGADPWRVLRAFSFASVFARAAMSVCINVSDAAGAFTIGSAIVVISASVQNVPILTRVSGNLSMSTQGGETLTFTGANFNPTWSVVAWYTNGVQSYNATNCSVVAGSNDTLTCRTVPGAGAGLVWNIWLAGTQALAAAPITTSYAQPVIDSIQNGGALPTLGGALISFVGSNFGPRGTPVFVTYGATNQYACSYVAASSNESVITCAAALGSGANLPWRVTVAGQAVSSIAVSPLLSYAPPVITDISVVGDVITAMDTTGGAEVYVNGVNFGELTAPASVFMNAPGAVLAPLLNCIHVTLTQLRCASAAAVGANLPFTVTINGVSAVAFTSGVASAGQGVSYRLPQLLSIVGPGAVRANTQGGQLVTLSGANFGPYGYPALSAYIAVSYSGGNLTFTATGCVVQASTTMTCNTGPGVGAGLSWQMTVGGQLSNVLPSATSYGPPVVTGFTADVGVDPFSLPTAGLVSVFVNGANFGSAVHTTPDRLLVSYGVPLNNGPVPAVFYPSTCSVSLDHVQLSCTVQPGAGANLVWSIVVAGQVSVQPTTSYQVPLVTNVTTLDGAAASAVSVDGETVILVQGVGFGPATYPGTNASTALVQSVSYGPTGVEYIVAPSRMQLLAGMLRITLLPGAGSNLQLRVSVADQTSAASSATFSFARATIVAMYPATFPTLSPAFAPNVMTLVTRHVPVYDPQSRVFVSFGVGVFQQFITVAVPSSPAAVATVLNPDGTMNISMPVPTGAGSSLPVQLVVMRASALAPSLAGASVVSEMTPASLFSYAQPVISSVSLVTARFLPASTGLPSPSASPSPSVSPSASVSASPSVSASSSASPAASPEPSLGPSATPSMTPAPSALPSAAPTTPPVIPGTDRLAIPCPFTVADAPTWRCNDPAVLMLVITGANFAASPPGPRPDGVTRSLTMITNTTTTWTAQPLLYLYSWNHTQIVAFTKETAGTVNVSLLGTAWDGAPTLQTVSYSYSQRSPFISALSLLNSGGAPVALNSTGGDRLNVTVGSLAGATGMFVTIGGRLAQLQTMAGVNVTDAYNQIILNPSVSSVGQYVWTFAILVPPGQGSAASNPVVITSVFGSITQPSDPGFAIAYAEPVVKTVVAFMPGANGTFAWTAFPQPSIVIAPTLPTRVRVFGANLGDSPAILVGDGVFLTGRGAVFPCAPDAGVSPDMHGCYEFLSPAGEGTGLQAAMGGAYTPFNGYRLLLVAGDQPAQDVQWRYLPPTVNAVLPMSGGFPTSGGVTVLVLGVNFGANPRPLTPSVLSVNFAPTPAISQPSACTNVLRLNHTALTCTLPVGAGEALSVQVWIADQQGVGASIMSYDRPFITAASSSEGSIPTPSWAPVPSAMPWLRAPTLGGSNITIFGGNFGRAPVDGSICVMFAWVNRGAWVVPRCDGVGEEFAGAFGIVPVASVRAWNHTTVTFTAPPGLGLVDVQFSVAGRTDGLSRTGAASARILRLLYNDPFIIGMQPVRPRTNLQLVAGQPAVNGVPDTIQLGGRNFGPPPGAIRFAGVIPPHLRVQMHYRCVTNVTELNSDCVASSLQVVTQNLVRFPTTLGVGLEKNLSIAVVDEGTFVPYVQSSPMYNFSYRAPNIASLSTTQVYMTDGRVPVQLDLRGGADQGNFGYPAPLHGQYQYTLPETVTRVWLSGFQCPSAFVTTDGDTGASLVRAFLPSNITVGPHNVTLQTGGQFAGAPWLGGAAPIEVGCAATYFGRVNETCLACPTPGAVCPGFNVSSRDPAIRYPYPIATVGFFDLSGPMATACPFGQAVPGRDVCIVACQPPEACAGANLCAVGYVSNPPLYRCGSCARGFYPAAGACIKCPDSPASLFIGFILIVMGAAVAGFILNKKGVNIAFVSIGVDFMQVIAMFANARIPWPPSVKSLFQIMAAFNLNLEVVAPECLIPSVSFQQKFAFIVLLPATLGGVFLLLHSVGVGYKYCIKGQRKDLLRHTGGLISAFLVLFYVLYLYITKTLLDVFNCVPTDPPDGNTYLQVVFEPCGVPGGTQLTLMPWAVIGLFVYSLGYPAFVVSNLWRNRELAMQDQYLRAKGTGNDVLTNPHAYRFRRQFGRTYYQFKPDFLLWIGVIIARKLCIAICYLMFNRNSAFQMAACLLVLFVAYALQVRFSPYMSPADFEDVARSLNTAALTSAMHARLREVLAHIQHRGHKRTHKNLMTYDGKVDRTALLGVLTSFIFNYNTVEATLLFCGVLVCLCAVMYQAVQLGGVYYQSSRDYVTAAVMAVIIFGIVYFVACVVTEVTVLLTESQRAAAWLKERSSGTGASKRKLAAASGVDAQEKFEARLGKVDAQMNPMFYKQSADGNSMSIDASSVADMVEPPPPQLWSIFRESYTSTAEQVKVLSGEVAALKQENAELDEFKGLLAQAKGGRGEGIEMQSIAKTKRQFAARPSAINGKAGVAQGLSAYAPTAAAVAAAGGRRRSTVAASPGGRRRGPSANQADDL